MPDQSAADDRGGRLSTQQAAALLGVKPTTLYAYVSRGLLTSHRGHDGRTSTFDRAEVEALLARQQGPRPAGEPCRINTAITLITEHGHFYRGHDAIALSEGTPFEAVAELLWTGQPPDSKPPQLVAAPAVTNLARKLQATLPPGSLLLDRLITVVLAAASDDEFRYDTSGSGVAMASRGLLAAMVDGLVVPVPGHEAGAEPLVRPTGTASLAERLWLKLSPLKATADRVRLLNGVLVLLADHELAPSTIAVRLAAAYHADPYLCVAAAISTLSGARHGRVALAHEAMFRETHLAEGQAGAALAERLRLSGSLEGPNRAQYKRLGDPRAKAILAHLREAFPSSSRLEHVEAVLRIIERRGLGRPSLELALAAVVHAAEMPYGSSEILFAIGKTPGWLAHAIEEYHSPSNFSPTVNYVGAKARDFLGRAPGPGSS